MAEQKWVLLRADGSVAGQVVSSKRDLRRDNPDELDAVEVSEFAACLHTQRFDRDAGCWRDDDDLVARHAEQNIDQIDILSARIRDLEARLAAAELALKEK